MKFLILFLALALVNADTPTTTGAPDTTIKPNPPPGPEPGPKPGPEPGPKPGPEPGPAPAPAPIVPTVSFQLEGSDKKTIVAIGEFQGTLHLTLPGQKNPIDWPLDNRTVLDVKQSKQSPTDISLVFNVNGSDATVVTFNLKSNNKTYSLDDITVQWTVTDEKKDSVVYTGDWNGTLFSVSADHSYLCLSQQSLKFSPDKKTNAIISFDVDNFKIDAFRSTDTTDLRTASECEMDDKKRDFVPLAVGGSLIALVVIVLIAFLIGRKRSRRLAYESV